MWLFPKALDGVLMKALALGRGTNTWARELHYRDINGRTIYKQRIKYAES